MVYGFKFLSINLKTAVSPRKARKTRKKSVCCICAAIHPLGDDLQLGISLNIFVLFVFFVDQMIFLGSSKPSSIKKTDFIADVNLPTSTTRNHPNCESRLFLMEGTDQRFEDR